MSILSSSKITFPYDSFVSKLLASLQNRVSMQSVFLQRTGPLKISLVAILSAFAVEFVFGIFSNSLALLTDSIHALLDSVVTVILLLAARLAA